MNAPRVAQDNPFKQSYIDAASPTQGDPNLAMPIEDDFARAAWVWTKLDRRDSVREGETCSNCGDWRQAATEEEHEVVRRIVREGATVGYGAEMMHGGGEVFIEPRHLSGALFDTTCSPRQWEAMQEAKRRRVEARPPQLLSQIKSSATVAKASFEETNRRGREAMLEQFRVADARQRGMQRRRATPTDEESPPPARRDVIEE